MTTALPEGITPLDIADELHRRQLTDPTFDPIEYARDSARRAVGLLLDGVAYLDGEANRTRLWQILSTLVRKDTEPGDAQIVQYLRQLAIWYEMGLEDAKAEGGK